MPPSVSRQWFRLLARQRSITLRQSNSKFSSRQHAQFHYSGISWDILGYLARTCRRRKAWTICESKRSSECYQRQMARYQWPDSQKSYIAVEKAFSSCGKAEWRTYSAHFLLISWLIRITVTFWCSLRTTNNINDELLANISLVSRLIWKRFRWKFIDVFELFAYYIHAFLLSHFT